MWCQWLSTMCESHFRPALSPCFQAGSHSPSRVCRFQRDSRTSCRWTAGSTPCRRRCLTVDTEKHTRISVYRPTKVRGQVFTNKSSQSSQFLLFHQPLWFHVFISKYFGFALDGKFVVWGILYFDLVVGMKYFYLVFLEPNKCRALNLHNVIIVSPTPGQMWLLRH